jgi:hypothetical protein
MQLWRCCSFGNSSMISSSKWYTNVLYGILHYSIDFTSIVHIYPIQSIVKLTFALNIRSLGWVTDAWEIMIYDSQKKFNIQQYASRTLMKSQSASKCLQGREEIVHHAQTDTCTAPIRNLSPLQIAHKPTSSKACTRFAHISQHCAKWIHKVLSISLGGGWL